MANGPVTTGKPVPKIKFTRENILGTLGVGDLTYQTQDRMKASIARRTAFGNVGAKTSASGSKGVSGTGSSPLSKKKINWKGALDETKPYLSNIVNSFSSVPKPSVPGLTNMVNIPRVNLNNARNVVERSARSTDLQASRSLDENTAASVHQATLANKIQGMNDIADREANANAQIAGQQAQINAGIEGANNATMNQYRDNVTNAAIATQRERSGNFANAIDKSIAIDNEKAKGQLELHKMKVMSEMWKQSGVYDRMLQRMRKAGITNPEGIAADGTSAFRAGGQMRKVFGGGDDPNKPPATKTTFSTQAEVNAANLHAKRFALDHGLVSGEETYVAKKPGDALPFVRYSGLPLPPGGGKQLARTVPSGITMNDIKGDGSAYWYEDPHNGNVVDINPGTVFPKFGVTPAQAMKDIAARNKKPTFRRGGFMTRKSII